MKLLLCILLVVGAFLCAVGILPNGEDAEDRMSNAFMAFIGAGILVLDGCIWVCWMLLRAG